MRGIFPAPFSASVFGGFTECPGFFGEAKSDAKGWNQLVMFLYCHTLLTSFSSTNPSFLVISFSAARVSGLQTLRRALGALRGLAVLQKELDVGTPQGPRHCAVFHGPSCVPRSRKRGQRQKLMSRKFHLHMRKNFFPVQ